MANVSDTSHMLATQYTGEEAADGFQKAGFGPTTGSFHLHLDKVCLLIEHRAENILFPTYFNSFLFYF